MSRWYLLLADKLRYFPLGRALVDHILRHRRFYENFEAFYTTLVLVLLIKAYIFELYKIPSGSMLDTLEIGDRIFVNKFIYDFTPIAVGDIVVFKTKGIDKIYSPDKPYYIKRVVGLPGDHLEIKPNGFIFRNGQLLDQPNFFLENRYSDYYGRRTFDVPPGRVYCFGDNSRNSLDSRDWGGVPLKNVMGKAFFRYWPLSRFGWIRGVPPAPVRQEVARQNARLNRNSSLNRVQAAEPSR